jgi:hypothetical protein
MSWRDRSIKFIRDEIFLPILHQCVKRYLLVVLQLLVVADYPVFLINYEILCIQWSVLIDLHLLIERLF